MEKNDRSLSNRNRSNLSDARGIPTNSLSLDAFYQKAKRTVNRFVLGLKEYFDFLVHGDTELEGTLNVGGDATLSSDLTVTGDIETTGGNFYENAVRVIESGSNSNGYWVKYVDGTLLQYGILSYQPNCTIPRGAIFGGSAITVTLPISFLNTNYWAYVIDSIDIWFGVTPSAISSFTFTTLFYTTLGGTRTAKWSAVGRWK